MMRHTLFALVCAAVSTVASAAFWPFSLFADDASASVVGAPVVSNGVTRTRLGSLYRDSLVVTDVDLSRASPGITNIVAGSNIVVTDVAPGVKSISAVSGAGSFAEISGRPEDNALLREALGSKAPVSSVAELTDMVLDHNVTLAVVSNGMDRVAETNELLQIRIDGLDTTCDLLERGLTNLENRMPFQAEVRAYSIFDGHIPALRVPYAGDGGGLAFYVLCADGVYRDSIDPQADLDRQPVFSVQSLYGHMFEKERLEELLPGVEWTSGFTLSSANVLQPLSAVCGGVGYPKCYGRAATVYELVLDLAGRDRSLWEDPTARGYADEEADAYIPFSGLERAMNKADAYAAGAYAAVAGLRAEYEEGPAAGRYIGKAIQHVDVAGAVVSLVPDTLTLAVVSNAVSWFAVQYEMTGPLVTDERAAACRMAVRCFGRTRIVLLSSQAGDIPFGPSSIELLPGDSIVTVERVAHDGGSGLTSISAIRLDESAIPAGDIVDAATNAVMSAVTHIVGDASDVLSSRIDDLETNVTAAVAGKLDDDFNALTNSTAFTNAVATIIPRGVDEGDVVRILGQEMVVQSNAAGVVHIGNELTLTSSSGSNRVGAYAAFADGPLNIFTAETLGELSDTTWLFAGARSSRDSLDSIGIGTSATVAGDCGTAVGAASCSESEAVSVGYNSHAGDKALAVGVEAQARGEGIALGYQAGAYAESIAIGVATKSEGEAVSVGNHASANSAGVAVGMKASASVYSTAIGYKATASMESIAIGPRAKAIDWHSIVISPDGYGRSHGDGTLNFGGVDSPDNVYFMDRTLTDMIRAESSNNLYVMTNANGASFTPLASGTYALKAPSEWHPAADPAAYLSVGRVSFSKVFAARVGNELIVSSNGVDWVFSTTAGLTTEVAGCGDGLYAGRFVAGTSGGVYAIDASHPDNAKFVPLTQQFRAVFCGIGNHESADGRLYPVWIGVRASDNRLFMSTDAGFNWGDIGLSAQLDAVASDGLGSIVGVYEGNKFCRMQIPDGQETYTGVIPGCSDLVDIACGGGRYVAVCGASAGDAYAYSSDDGVSWSPVYGTPQGFRAITYGAGLFVACEAAAGGVWYSQDGLAWAKAAEIMVGAGETITYGNGRFVCGTAGGVVYCDVPVSNVIPVVQHVVVNGRRLPVGDNNTVSISAVPLSRRINGQSLDGDVWIETPSDTSLVLDNGRVKTKAGDLVSAEAVDAYTKAGAKAMAENVAAAAVADSTIVRRDSPALTITAPGFNATGTNMGFRAKNTTYADGRINVTAGTNAYAVALPATNGTLARESWSSLSAMLVDANTNLDADRTSISTNLSKLVGSAGSIDGYVFDKDHVAMWYLDSGGYTNFVLRYTPSPYYGQGTFSVAAFGGYSDPVMYAMALGPAAIASGESSTALGTGAYATGSSSVALGSGAAANGSYTVALGPGADASVSYAIALGLEAKASEENAVALGHNAAASKGRSVALGTDTIANEWYSTAVGDYARAQGNCSLALGASPFANATHAMALGPYAVAGGNYSIALGSSVSAGWDHSVVIGSPAPGSGYSAHGTNTVNFAVTDNPDAVYFRDKTLSQMIREKAAELIKDAVKDLGPDVTAAALVEALKKIGEQ